MKPNLPAVTWNNDLLSTAGKWGFVLSSLFVFSISAEYRLHALGFLIHPYLILLPFALLFTDMKVTLIPSKVLIPLTAFFILFSIGSLQNSNPLDEIIKVAAALLTFLFFATAVRSEKDFRLISIGFILCGLVIGYLGFGIGEEQVEGRLDGINALEGIGNKNAQSLFTLPAVFLAVLLTLYFLRQRKYLFVGMLLIAMFYIVVGIFLSANRSGWVGLGVIVIAYFIYLKFKTSTFFIGGIIFLFSYIGINYYASDIVSHKANKTLGGYRSDEGRLILIRESLRVGLENPIFGVGKDELHRRMNLAVRVPSRRASATDTHFLIGFLIGSTGLLSLLSFLLFLYQLTTYVNGSSVSGGIRDAKVLMTAFVILYILRSLFTREILYSPTFMGCLGLLYGHYLLQYRKMFMWNKIKLHSQQS